MNRASTTRGVPGDRLPLPACSYVNTDFPGDNLVFDDGTTRGLNAGSARLVQNIFFQTFLNK